MRSRLTRPKEGTDVWTIFWKVILGYEYDTHYAATQLKRRGYVSSFVGGSREDS